MASEKCKCAVCEYYREFERQLELVPESARPFFEGLYDRYVHAETDAQLFRHSLGHRDQ